jgi:hypothetical protein
MTDTPEPPGPPSLEETPVFNPAYQFPPSRYVWAELREATEAGLVRRGILYAAITGRDNGVMPVGTGTSVLQMTLDGTLKSGAAGDDYPGGQAVMDAWQDYTGPNKPWQLGPPHTADSRSEMIEAAYRSAAASGG